MRKAAIGVGVVILIAVVAVGIFALTFDVNQYHSQIQAQLQQTLGRNVSLGQMSLGFFPPRFQVQDVAISDDPHFGQAKFIQAKQLDVSVKLLPLLSKSVEIDSLNLQRPSIEMFRNAAGVWNFSSLGNNSKSGSQSSSSKQQLSLSELTVKDGQVAITDQLDKRPRAVYDHIDLTLRDYAANSPFSVDLAAHLPGAGSEEIRLQGKGGPIANDPASTPFKGTLNFKEVHLAGLSQFLSSPALKNTDGVLSGEIKINSEAGQLRAVGQTSVQDAKVNGTALGFPITTDYDISDNVPNDLITVHNTTIKLGPTPLTINGTVDTKPTPAQINLAVKANNVSIAEAAKLAALAGVAFAPGVNVTGNVNVDVAARGAATMPALNGTITAQNLQASGNEIKQPVQVKSVLLNLTPAEVRSNNFDVVSGGTAVNTQFTLRNYTAKTPSIDATLRAPNAGLAEILSIARAYGVTSLDKLSGSGTLNLNLRASGPLQSVASAEVARALNGTLALNFNNMRYTGVDINHQLGAIAGFLGGKQGSDQGYTNISKMTGNIAITNGVAATKDLQAQLDLGNVGAVGTANLVNQTFNLHVNAVLTKGTSQQVGGNGVGGFMQTALANNNGELVIPAIVTGTFQNPHFEPDVNQVAQMKLKGLVPSLSNPSGGASGLLGGLLGGKAAPAGGKAAAQPDAQQNSVDQIIGLFGKKKKPQK